MAAGSRAATTACPPAVTTRAAADQPRVPALEQLMARGRACRSAVTPRRQRFRHQRRPSTRTTGRSCRCRTRLDLRVPREGQRRRYRRRVLQRRVQFLVAHVGAAAGVCAGQAFKAGAGLFGATDGTQVWLFFVNTDAANSILHSRFNGSAWSAWTPVTGTDTGTHNRGFVSGAPIVSANQSSV